MAAGRVMGGAMGQMIDEWLRGLVADGPMVPRRGQVHHWLLIACILGSTSYAIIDTVPAFWGDFQPLIIVLDRLALALMTVDYAVRLCVAWAGIGDERRWAGMGRYMVSAYGLFDVELKTPGDH